MKQFNLKEYKRLIAEGKKPKIVTRNRESVRILATDMRGERPVAAVIDYISHESVYAFTAYGCFSTSIEHPSSDDLFFDDLVEVPIYDFKPFDRVLVRDGNDKEWSIDLFDQHVKTCEHEYFCFRGSWKQCIPYKGNEQLLGTTDKNK